MLKYYITLQIIVCKKINFIANNWFTLYYRTTKLLPTTQWLVATCSLKLAGHYPSSWTEQVVPKDQDISFLNVVCNKNKVDG